MTNVLGATSFSQVSGLDESGSMHGAIRSVNEPEATKGLAQHFRNAVDLLSAQLVGYQMVDNSFADVLGSVGQSVMGASFKAVIDDVNTEQPLVNNFTANNPVAGKPFSLDTLNSQMIATDVVSMAGMSADWADTAGTIGEALTFIPRAIADLQGSAETESIAKAIHNLGQVEAAGSQYMANASALATHTASLVTVAEANALQVAAALAVVRATPNPVVAKALEESFLAAFSPKLTTELVPVTPLFNQLLPELGAPNGAGTDESGALAPEPPSFDNTPLPKIVQQALSNAGYRELAYASTPTQVVEQFGRPNPDVLQSIAAGATPTQAASAAAPTMPPSLTGVTGMGTGATGAGASGAGMPGAGVGQLAAPGAGSGAGVAGPGLGFTPSGAGSAGPAGAGKVRPAAGLTGSGSGLAGASGPGLGGFAHNASPGRAGGPALLPTGGADRGLSNGGGAFGGARGGSAGSGMGAVPGAVGAGRMSGIGAPGGGAGTGPVGGFGPGASGGLGAGAVGQGNNTFVGGGQPTNGQSGTRGVVAGGPGMYGAGQRGASNGKRGKVQAVTSAVEREGNLKALLGEAPEVVPGVIGAWVREPRP